MKLFFALMTAFLLVSCNSNSPKTASNSITAQDSIILQVSSAANNGQIDKAIDIARNFTINYPNNDTSWIMLGGLYEQKKQDSLAFEIFSKALSLNSNNYSALTELGFLVSKKNNYDKAFDYYQKSLVINPNYAKTYTNMCIDEIRLKKYKQALVYGQKAYSLDSSDLPSLDNLIVCYNYNNVISKRDSLFGVLQKKGYTEIAALRNFIYADTISKLEKNITKK